MFSSSRRLLKPISSLSGSFRTVTDNVVLRCEEKLKAALNPIQCKVRSSNDDPNGSHIFVEIISENFSGKNVVQRQKLVYKAIWEELEGPVHAVDGIVAKTPKEVGL